MPQEYSEDKLIEQTAMELFFDRLGWDTAIAYNVETFGDSSSLGRFSNKEVVLKHRTFEKLKEFNPGLPEKAYKDAYEKLLDYSITKSLAEINKDKYKLLRDGIPVDYINELGELIKSKYLRVFDFENPENNNFISVRQMWIKGKSNRLRRPDIIGFVNGIPLLFIELKAAHRKLEKAYDENLTDYFDVIPELFHFNAFVLLSNGIQSRIGSITGKYHHFHEWKRITEEDNGVVALDRIILGICDKKRFLDLFENFILFDTSGKIVKIIARNHQFIGVNKAVDNIILKDKQYKNNEITIEEKQKLGVFWHTQGSGKSFSMVFLTQKVHRKFSGSYTFLIVTDRNELDTQIYGTFSGVGAVPQIVAGNRNSVKASSGEDLKSLLKQENRYLFTLIHKFNFETEITQRENIIVISDEAHRTQGGTLAMNMRNALPNASFIGFTGTPLFKDDELTKRIFGDYVSIYDFKKSVEDGATVPLYYENRGEYLGLQNINITQQIRDIIDENDDLDSDQRQRLEQLFARDYPILTSQKRLEAIAKDVVWHYCNQGYKGKAMFVAIDKLIAVKMYDLITENWNKYIISLEKEISKGKFGDQELLEKQRELNWIKETEICVVISSEQNEIKKFRNWDLDIEPHRNKMNSRELETDFKDDNHPFRFVIVCAMWITGFDVPSLSTMYIDKPLKSHTLMQTIARANRIHEGKNNGLIVDYIETYKSILEALAIYATGGKTGGDDEEPEPPLKPKEDLIPLLEESLYNIEEFLKDEVNFDLDKIIYQEDKLLKLAAIEQGIDAVYTNDETKIKFQLLAREVFKKYKAIMPNKLLYQYSAKKYAIDEIYRSIEDNIESADIAEIMTKIQSVVDKSIENLVSEPTLDYKKVIDLSSLDFEILKKLFEKTDKKNTLVQDLKNKIEKQLQRMVDNNPLRVDFYQKYQEIIDEYNRGKDSVTIEETFRKLIEFVNSLSEEEARVKREDLSEEQMAIFDLLRKPDLSKSEKQKVKDIAIELLDELKKEKLKVEMWSEKSATSASVFKYVNTSLFNNLPYPTYQNDDIDIRTAMIYEHLKTKYYCAGRSVYGYY
jgi:type I restriction enzyme R subunit